MKIRRTFRSFRRNGGVSILTLLAVSVCLLYPRSGFSEDKSAGFYAGPLSAVTEKVVEKEKLPVRIKPIQETEEDQEINFSGQVSEEPEEVGKTSG